MSTAVEGDCLGYGRENATDCGTGSRCAQVGMRIGGFNAENQVLPLCVVTEKSAASERAASAFAEHRDAGRMDLLLKGCCAQAEGYERLRGIDEIGGGVVVARHAADIEA